MIGCVEVSELVAVLGDKGVVCGAYDVEPDVNDDDEVGLTSNETSCLNGLFFFDKYFVG